MQCQLKSPGFVQDLARSRRHCRWTSCLRCCSRALAQLAEAEATSCAPNTDDATAADGEYEETHASDASDVYYVDVSHPSFLCFTFYLSHSSEKWISSRKSPTNKTTLPLCRGMRRHNKPTPQRETRRITSTRVTSRCPVRLMGS